MDPEDSAIVLICALCSCWEWARALWRSWLDRNTVAPGPASFVFLINAGRLFVVRQCRRARTSSGACPVLEVIVARRRAECPGRRSQLGHPSHLLLLYMHSLPLRKYDSSSPFVQYLCSVHSVAEEHSITSPALHCIGILAGVRKRSYSGKRR